MCVCVCVSVCTAVMSGRGKGIMETHGDGRGVGFAERIEVPATEVAGRSAREDARTTRGHKISGRMGRGRGVRYVCVLCVCVCVCA